MAQTTFKLAASKVDTPLTAGDTPSTQKTSSGGKTGAGNQGFLTDASVSKDIISTVSTPMVSGAFLFAGIILLLALVAKIKKNKTSNFKDSLTRKHYTTRILGFAAFLTLAAGLGGTMARFVGTEATSELSDITTSGTVEASLVEVTNDYKLYCGTDNIVLNGPSSNGYYLFMYADQDGTLTSYSSGIANIESAGDWEGLNVGEWGYFVGNKIDYTDAVKNPMPMGYSIIDNKDSNTEAGIVPVTYCAKVARNIENENFSTTINYDILVKDEDFNVAIDFNSAEDDDNDGISNREENRYGMNPVSSDSDLDSLGDYEEIHIYGTNPVDPDTDGDGLRDYSEIALSNAYHTDPLNPKSNGVDLDGDRTYTYSEPNGETTGVPFTVTGTGDIPLTYIDVANPDDIVDDLEEFSGTAYVFQSEGQITSAQITVPYVNETEAGTATVDDITGDIYGAVEVSNDYTGTESDLYALSLTFENPEGSQSENEASVVISDIDKSVDSTNKTISVDITKNSSLILVGNDNTVDSDVFGEEYGAKINLKAVVQKVKTVVAKVKPVVVKIVQTAAPVVKKIVTTFVNTVAENNCIKKGGTWNQETGKCEQKPVTVNPPQDPPVVVTWTKKNNFKVNTSNGDSFRKFVNYGTSGANLLGTLISSQGQCYGIAQFVRLLYLRKIDLNKTHTVSTQTTGSRSFNLKGKSKDTILNTAEGSAGGPADNDVRGAINAMFMLQDTDMSNILESKGNVDTFLNKLESNVESDPLVFSISSSLGGHSVNLISISGSSESNVYYLSVYDNNYKDQARSWTMTCTKESCTIGNDAGYGVSDARYRYLSTEGESYFE